MTATAKKPMSADEFLAWGEGQEGRWELHDGAVVAMAPERLLHSQCKGRVYRSLSAAIERAGSFCEALPDGPGVRIEEDTVFEPDALVYCGSAPPSGSLEISNPVVVVEVLSPSTAALDHGVKLTGYFSLSSVMHYLIVDADRRLVIHHKRGQGDVIETRIFAEGFLKLQPPGLDLSVDEIFPA